MASHLSITSAILFASAVIAPPLALSISFGTITSRALICAKIDSNCPNLSSSENSNARNVLVEYSKNAKPMRLCSCFKTHFTAQTIGNESVSAFVLLLFKSFSLLPSNKISSKSKTFPGLPRFVNLKSPLLFGSLSYTSTVLSLVCNKTSRQIVSNKF